MNKVRTESNDHGIINVLYAAMHMVNFLKSHSVGIENHFGHRYIESEKNFTEQVSVNALRNSFFFFKQSCY